MATMPINGTTLYYEEAGSGPGLLFVHGMCGDARTWQDQMRRLSPHFRCVAYDRRGHTRSPLGAFEQRSVELHADDAAAMIRALHLVPCLIVGSSSGGRIGLDVMRRYPELLSGAVLSEPPLLSLDPDAAGFIGELKPTIEAAVAAGGPRAAVDAFFGMVCPRLWSAIDESRRDGFRENATELFGDLQMPTYAVAPADLRAIAVPCRVIQGDSSQPTMRRICGIVAQHLPNADLVELHDCDHVTYFEQPEAFAEAVTSFAAGLPPAGAASRSRVALAD